MKFSAALANWEGTNKRMKTKTAVGAYADTPHKTIEELIALAACRAAAGENPLDIVQDLVDGYNLGWQSANHRLIERAAKEAQ